MAQVTITINSREYAIACEDGQEMRIIQLARMLDEKAKLLNTASGQVNEGMLLAMVGLLLADELCELKKGGAVTENPVIADKIIADTDAALAAKIKTLTDEIKSIASRINIM